MHLNDLTFTLHRYDTQRDTQRVGIWEPPKASSSNPGSRKPKGYWLIYIHGGAWRDPSNTYNDFIPTIKHILSSEHASSVRGFASIDYRLSPHPNLPQDPVTTPAAEFNDAKHPDHLDDVCAALKLIRTEHGVEHGSYVIIGHSAGATLACQVLLSLREQIPLPAAVVGVSGIYSLPQLVKSCGPYYETFVRGAFGGPENWEAASPALSVDDDDDDDDGKWPADVLPCLVWSTGDTLIPASETDVMAERLRGEGRSVIVYKDLEGEHDTVWGEGRELASAVQRTLVVLDGISDSRKKTTQ